MQLTIEFDRETDGRHIAEVPELPGCLAYGETRAEADAHVRALAFHILADQGLGRYPRCGAADYVRSLDGFPRGTARA